MRRYLSQIAMVCILACIGLATAACGGTQATQADQIGDAQLNASLPPLAEIAELARTASADVELVRLGSATYTQSGGATADGDNLVLATTENSPLEWGMYLYTLTDKVPKRFNTSVTVNSGKYWLAVGNFGSGLWEMVGPYEEVAQEFITLPAANYKSDPGNLVVIAVLAGRMNGTDADISIQRVVLTAGGGTSPEL